MVELGKSQILKVVKETDFGIYLGDEEEKVLLPKKQVPENTKIGDEIQVFVYKDSSDRIICTINKPKIQLDEVTTLSVKQVTSIGAFLDWGLEKDLLLPFKEQTKKVEVGENHLVTLYVDKSSRLCATMRVYDYLKTTDQYKVDDIVMGKVYEINEQFGAFVAIDNQYYGMIPGKEMFSEVNVGDEISARVTSIREDGKYNLSIRKKAYLQMDEDALYIMTVIKAYHGKLPYNDKVSPEVIKRDFNLSKNAFKRAIGKLLKEGKIQINENSINLKEDEHGE